MQTNVYQEIVRELLTLRKGMEKLKGAMESICAKVGRHSRPKRIWMGMPTMMQSLT